MDCTDSTVAAPGSAPFVYANFYRITNVRLDKVVPKQLILELQTPLIGYAADRVGCRVLTMDGLAEVFNLGVTP